MRVLRCIVRRWAVATFGVESVDGSLAGPIIARLAEERYS